MTDMRSFIWVDRCMFNDRFLSFFKALIWRMIENVTYVGATVEENIDIAIIATNSDITKFVIESLLEKIYVRYLILEKVVFQTVHDFGRKPKHPLKSEGGIRSVLMPKWMPKMDSL